jgi:uncharacterized protein YraI
MSFARTLIAAVAVLALSSALAAATPATLERNAKVRTGPGAKYQVVATLRRGTVVDVSGCAGAWCEVGWAGGQGYVAHTLLAAGPAPVGVLAPVQPYYSEDYPGFDFPGYGYEPTIAVVPRPYRRWARGRGWHHRPDAVGWAARPGQLATGTSVGATNPERIPLAPGGAAASAASASALKGARPALVPSGAAGSVTGSIERAGAPMVSAPAGVGLAVSAPGSSDPIAGGTAAMGGSAGSVNTPLRR